MPVPEIRLTFDTDNFTTFIKELLNLEEKTVLEHHRFDSTIFIKCNGNTDKVRADVLKWLTDLADPPKGETKVEEPTVFDKIKAGLPKGGSK